MGGKDLREDLTFKRRILVMETVKKVLDMVLLFKFSCSYTMPFISRLDASERTLKSFQSIYFAEI